MSAPVFYDDSLLIAVDCVSRHLAPDASVSYLRDGQGHIHVFVSEETNAEAVASLDAELREGLGGYTPSFGPLVHLGEPHTQPALLVIGDRRIRYIERRFAGADWTQSPVPVAGVPARLVFYSIKGGVGRTTALTVLATQIAARGGYVLCIDLDLEAPGLGQALLPIDQTPEFGALDWLAERAVQGVANESLPQIADLVGVSPIGRETGGRIDVIPAFGQRCLRKPGNILGKLSRSLLESSEDGAIVTFGSRVSQLIALACQTRGYAAVLIDIRAGLSEISAAPLLALGADVLLFMTDGNQSFASYSALLSYLQRYAPANPELDDWRLRFKAVRGRVANTSDAEAGERFLDRVANIFSETLYDAGSDATDPNTFNFAPDDVNAPHYPVTIAFDPRFQTFEPLVLTDQASAVVANAAFGEFTRWCIERLGLLEEL